MKTNLLFFTLLFSCSFFSSCERKIPEPTSKPSSSTGGTTSGTTTNTTTAGINSFYSFISGGSQKAWRLTNVYNNGTSVDPNFANNPCNYNYHYSYNINQNFTLNHLTPNQLWNGFTCVSQGCTNRVGTYTITSDGVGGYILTYSSALGLSSGGIRISGSQFILRLARTGGFDDLYYSPV